MFRKYTKQLLFSTLALLALTGVFNWFVDPYGLYSSPRIEGFNSLKPEVNSHLKLWHAGQVRKVKPKAIVLGTSRAAGIDTGHEGWAYEPVYNLGFGGATIYEMLRYFQHSHNAAPLKQVLLTLDFQSFNVLKRNADDFSEASLSADYDGKRTAAINNDAIATLFSADALFSSLHTIEGQESARSQTNAATDARVKAAGGYRAVFLSQEKTSAAKTYPLKGFQFGNIDSQTSPFTYYRRILQIAYRDDIDLRMAISPSHARQWEVLAAAGLWPKFEEWKRNLVFINEEEARRSDKKPFPLWDFSVYNEFTTEAVPAPGDRETMMKWYTDSSHYKTELGNLALDRVFGYHAPGRVAPEDFGVLLASGNIQAHLEKIRADRQSYRDTHAADIVEIESSLIKP